MRICPIHGPGCYGIPEECAWIEADIQRRHAEGQCFQCGAYPPDYCERCHLIAARPAVKDGEQPRPAESGDARSAVARSEGGEA